jgi:hypothetical protein
VGHADWRPWTEKGTSHSVSQVVAETPQTVVELPISLACTQCIKRADDHASVRVHGPVTK